MRAPQRAAESYFRSAAMTAGRLKSYQLLLERAIVLVQETRGGEWASRNRCQDIVAQIQSGLHLEFESSRDLFKVMGILWDALEVGTPELLDAVEVRLRELRELMVELQNPLRTWADRVGEGIHSE